MNNKKSSFKELLKGLYQYEWTSLSLRIFIIVYISHSLMIFLFILLPNINNIHFNGLYVFFSSTFILYFIPILVKRVSNKNTDRAIYFTSSIIETIMENISNMDLFENENENTILENNLKSLYIFQKIHDYKYCMIIMGSIIEFLLVRYCNKNNIIPEPYTSSDGNVIPASKKRFCNYIQSAIKNDILGQKNSWYLIQNNLRNFRNYVHISKEIQEEEIDYDWFISTKSVYDRIIRNFKTGN